MVVLLLRHYGRLLLTVNTTKSTVAGVFQHKFLGYSLWVAPGGGRHPPLTAQSRNAPERCPGSKLGWQAGNTPPPLTSNFSNRRMRARLSGGVAGVEWRPSPLCRFQIRLVHRARVQRGNHIGQKRTKWPSESQS